MSAELKTFLSEKGVATSRSTPYNPEGNGQIERYNGIIWKAIELAAASRELNIKNWENVLPDALHSIRSLLCTSTNATPHERFFLFSRRSTNGTSVPTWLLTSKRVLLKRFVKGSKYESGVDEVELLETEPNYAHVRHADGRQSTVSLKHLAPLPPNDVQEAPEDHCKPIATSPTAIPPSSSETLSPPVPNPTEETNAPSELEPRRSTRVRRAPDRLQYS